MSDSRYDSIMNFDGYYDFIVSKRMATDSYPQHWHLAAEFFFITDGEFQWRIGTTLYNLKAGDVCLVWPAELHEIISSNGGRSSYIKFGSDIITRCHDINMNYRSMMQFHKIDEKNPELRKFLADKILEIHQIKDAHCQFAETRSRICIEEMLLRICSESLSLPAEQDEEPVANETYLKIKQACAYITDNCERDLSQSDVASLIGFSPYYFSRVFRKYADESFSEFLNHSRIRRAVRLLRISSIPVTEVAFSSGFQSISNFNKVFRSMMNCSPLEYRKLYNREHPSSPDLEKLH